MRKLFALSPLVMSLALSACVADAEVVVRTPPPPERVEVVAAAPYPGAVWIRGHWRWNGAAYVWIGGHWERPRVGWAWVPHHYAPYGRHWRYVPGHWRRV